MNDDSDGMRKFIITNQHAKECVHISLLRCRISFFVSTRRSSTWQRKLFPPSKLMIT